jgi:GntP family gluconate:H+ symporter
MSPFAPDTLLLLEALAAIVGLVVLVSALRVHPFIALTLAAGFVGLVSGMPIDKVIAAFQEGFGGVLGFVGIVLGLGTMLGKLMAESGGAAQVAQTLVGACGPRRVHWAMMLGAFLVGIPLFFEVGFVLLVHCVPRRQRPVGHQDRILLAGLSVVHGLVPHGPLLAIGLFNADIGLPIFYGLTWAADGDPGGPISGCWSRGWYWPHLGRSRSATGAQPLAATPPSFTVTVATILLRWR